MSHTRFLYHIVFRTKGGEPMIGASWEGESQITAFEDTWHWNLAAEETYHELMNAIKTHLLEQLSSDVCVFSD